MQKFAPVRALLCWLAIAPAIMVCSGCGGWGDGPERVVVSGKATYRGKPIAQGLIYFVPKSGNAAPTSIAKIEDGRYVGDQKGGIPVGTHHVKVMAYEKDAEVEFGSLVPEQYLPERYNRKSELEITITSENSPMTYDLDLDSE
jgi:hypothetical protein